MNPIDLIHLYDNNYTKSDKIVKDYILNNLDVISSYSITDVALKAGVSKSALLRFCKKLGYAGYAEFKYEISRYLISGTFENPSSVKSGKDFLNIYQSCISKIPEFIPNKSIISLCRLIKGAKKIKLYGVHESGLSSQYFSYRLASLGIDSESIPLPGTFSEKATFSDHDTLNLFFSISGTTFEITEAAKICFSKNVKTALITQNNKAKYFNKYDCTICIPSLNTSKSTLFLDSQAIVFITIDIIINTLAKNI